MSNGAERMRRELMIRMVREFRQGTLRDNIDRLPTQIRPRNNVSTRCCIYHDRAVIKYRLMALLGFDCKDETDETMSLSEYLDRAMTSYKRPEMPLTVCAAGCDGCPESRINITTNCRGCFARPCVFSCPRNAITVEDQHARVDYSKCIKCGKCLEVCPFHAIIKTTVPCEDACPVDAIRKNEFGVAEIDDAKCIMCGKCFRACPFSAVMERSELLHVLQELADGRKLVALVAPSAQFQFPGGVERLFSAISAAGFDDVIEVALGAEMTTENEAREFIERMEKGERLMTTSCCTSYVEMVKRHVPQLSGCVSDTPSPMRYAGAIARKTHPDALTVFIGPCIAKRYEAFHAENIDMVMNFEELGALLAGYGIDIMSQEPWPIPRPAIATARNFAKSCGVTEAVLKELLGEDGKIKLDSKFINGIDRKSAKLLALYAAGKLPGNFLEVMSCTGGCVGGPGSLIEK
ncbi:MAG: monomeric [FeFe] hydrogenase [Victivallaceae bacterium]|nr:monomeric [FeFe] hydrogenase [Victivallaceae bacterium]